MVHQVLLELVVVLVVAVAAAAAMRALRLPVITGYLLAGILVGPVGFGWITDRSTIEVLAEVGVVLLLFGVGLKLSLKELAELRGYVFGAGALQVLLTVALVAGPGLGLGLGLGAALVWGYIVALSSTALVLTVLEERGEVDTAHGRMMLGVLIFQDLATVPMMLSLPLLAGVGRTSWLDVGASLGKTVLLLAAVVGGARFLFPWILERIVRTRSREIFTLGMLVLAFGTALLVAEMGLSMAIGAFLAGIAISESEYAQQVLSEIATFRDAFNSLFFVSIGLLVDPAWWLERPAASALVFLAVVGVKGAVLLVLSLAAFRSVPAALLVGAGLAHAGEFSFVVAGAALGAGVLDESGRDLFLAVAVPSLVLAPLALTATAWLVRGRGVPGRPEQDARAAAPGEDERGRAVVVGFGLNGRNVARALRGLEIPYVVVEMNPIRLLELRRLGEPAIHGDATREPILRKAGLDTARALVVAISDPAGSRQIVATARRVNPGLRVIVRTRYVSEIEPLARMGADDVVPEEFETSLELTARVLATFGAPDHVVEREKALLRREQYRWMRGPTPPQETLSFAALMAHAAFAEVTIAPGSKAAGRSLAEIDLRRRTGVSILAVLRRDEVLANPGPELRLCPEDELLLIGSGEALERAERALRAGDDGAA